MLSPLFADSPGGYQILGKTLTPWSPWGRYDGEGHERLFLLRNFDVVHWLPMSEEEFLKVRFTSCDRICPHAPQS
mgnify:CR=1 FL=1